MRFGYLYLITVVFPVMVSCGGGGDGSSDTKPIVGEFIPPIVGNWVFSTDDDQVFAYIFRKNEGDDIYFSSIGTMSGQALEGHVYDFTVTYIGRDLEITPTPESLVNKDPDIIISEPFTAHFLDVEHLKLNIPQELILFKEFIPDFEMGTWENLADGDNIIIFERADGMLGGCEKQRGKMSTVNLSNERNIISNFTIERDSETLTYTGEFTSYSTLALTNNSDGSAVTFQRRAFEDDCV